MRPLLLLALPLAVAVTACGWFHRPTSPPSTATGGKAACAVNVYFVSHTTHAEERFVGTRLRQNPRIERVLFVSKAQALAEMEKKAGKLPKNFTNPNPLPDSFRVTPAQRAETGQLEASIARSHWPGVATVKLKLCKK